MVFFSPALILGPADPFWDQVGLLLLGDGANLDTTFTDLSPSPVTINNYTAEIRTDIKPSVTGITGSMDFNGGPYVTGDDASNYQFGTGDFCIEAYIRSTARDNNRGIIDFRGSTGSSNPLIENNDNGSGVFRFRLGGATIASTAGASNSSWGHYCMERVSGTVTCYYDGATIASSAYASAVNPTYLTLGSYIDKRSVSSAYHLSGSITFLRVTAAARYNGDFDPPVVRPYSG